MRDIGLLTSFVQAADSGNFSEAARRLALTPSTVSRNIARLEDDLGVRLFNRSTRILKLTTDGIVYLQSVKSALRLLEESEAQLVAAGTQPSGTLRVAVPVPFGLTYIVPRLREFLDSNERISLDISFEDKPVDPVRDGYDLVIRNGAPAEGTHIIRKLCEENLILVASPEYVALRGLPERPEDLVDHWCIAYKAVSNQTLHWKLRPTVDPASSEHNPILYDPHTRLRVFGYSHSGTDAALAGLGIAGVGHVHVRHLLAQGRLQIVLPDFRFVDESGLSQIFAVYPDRKFLPAKVRVFLDFVSDTIQKLDGELASQ